MIFQKKIIIGSIMSFVATALGVVAIFFPDLFNLQKKKMEELSIFLYEKDSPTQLYEFIKRNREKIIKLDISYCSTPNSDDPSAEANLGYSENETPKMAWDKDLNNERANVNIYSEVLVAGEVTFREKGYFSMPVYDKDLGWSLVFNLGIDESSEGGVKYIWSYDNLGGDDIQKKACKTYPEDEYPSIGGLSGTFFVLPDVFDAENIHYNLKPLSQVDLKLRNY